jgi:hypothetical protein
MSRRAATCILAVVVLAGCALVSNVPDPAADPGVAPGAPADGPQSRTECEEPLAFEGEATIAELGLADAIPNIADDATRRGLIRITRDMVTWEQFAPPDAPMVIAGGQLLCITFEDGTGIATLLHEPFAGIAAEAPMERVEFPLAPIAIVAVILLVAAVSWLAFRREARPTGR